METSRVWNLHRFYRSVYAITSLLGCALLCGVAYGQVLKGTKFLYSAPMQGYSQLGFDNDPTSRSALTSDSAGNVYATGVAYTGGVSNDWLTIKYDVSGNETWRAVLNGRGNTATGDDAHAVKIGPDGNPVVVGGSSHNAGTLYRRCTAAKYDAVTGREIWRVSPAPPSGWLETQCFGMSIDSAGNIIAVGRTREQYNFGNSGIYVVKFNSSGGVVWVQVVDTGAYSPAIVPPATVSAGSEDLAAFVVTDSSNNIYVAGRTQEDATNYRWAIMKFAAAGGAATWRTNVGTVGDSRPRGVAVNAAATQIAVVGTFAGQPGFSLHDSGTGAIAVQSVVGAVSSTGALGDVSYVGTDVVVSGWELLTGGTEEQIQLSRVSSTGVSVWNTQKSYGAGSRVRAFALVVNGNEIAITGSKGVLPAAASNADWDFYTARYNLTTGVEVGSAVTYAGPAVSPPARDAAFAITVDSAGNYVVGGTVVNGTSTPRNSMGVVKYSSALTQLWAKQPVAAPGGLRLGNLDGFLAKRVMALDNNGFAYFANRAHNGTSSYVEVIKLNTQTMAEAWRCNFDGSLDDFDAPYGLVLDSANNVIITGITYGPGSTLRDNLLALKITNNPTSCAIAWSKSITGTPTDASDFGLAVAVDSNDNVFVAGEFFLGATAPAGQVAGDWAVVKLSGVDGTEVWRYSLDGGSNLEDRAWLIRTGPGGAIYVSGRMAVGTSALPDNEWRLLKLQDNGTSASQAWVVTHTNAGADAVAAMHIEPDGSKVYLAGQVNSGTNFDMALRVYSNLTAATPAHALFTFTGNNNTGNGDIAKDVITDAAGNIYLTGLINNTTVLEELAVIKLNSAGVELWRALLAGTSLGNFDQGESIALTPDGPVVTGYVFNGTSFEMGTFQLRASDGAMMWYVSNDSRGRDYGQAVQVFPASYSVAPGRVVVAGWGGENNSINSTTGLALPETLVVQVVDRSGCTLKVDGRAGTAKATTDGLIVLRRILGILEPDASAGTTPANAIDPRDNLVSTMVLRKDYDVDMDGNVDFKDGLVILRYLLGFTGNTVTAGLGLTGGRNLWIPVSPVVPTPANSIKAYLDACVVL